MAGLDPAIHAMMEEHHAGGTVTLLPHGMDHRLKADDDEAEQNSVSRQR